LRLEPYHTPGTLDQRRPQSRVAVFGHAAWDPFSAATVFARTQTSVGADGAPVPKAFPRTDLAGHHHGS
jgi:hypothetical protein